MTRVFAIATALAVLSGWTFAAGPATAAKRGCAHAFVIPKAETVAQAHDAILCLLNTQRARRRTRALRRSAPLTRAAQDHSTDMVANGFFGHASPDGETPHQRAQRAGYAGGLVQETLAFGWARLSSPTSLLATLMGSPVHRRVLLDRRLRDIGIGLVLGAPQSGMAGGATLTLNLARR